MSQDLQAFKSLGDDVNKKGVDVSDETKQGVASIKLPELTLEMPDADITKLTTKWESKWKDSPKKVEWEKAGDENEKYWQGQQFEQVSGDKSRAQVDNLIFEALETYLPQATRRNPEPLVELDSSETSDAVKEKYVEKVKLKLAEVADKNKLRLKLKKGARFWAIFLLGPAKFGWDLDKNIPIVRIIRPKKLILDPDATIDEDGYTGEYIGEYRGLPASKIIAMMGEDASADAKKAIDDLVKDDKATQVNFIEWWTREYMCWTLGKNVLVKKKNPHWNYDRTDQVPTVDDYGAETVMPKEVMGINHLPTPDMPFKFLSVFNLGDQPMDKTSLMGQNLSNQDKINKRDKQIDKNVDRQNGGMVVSLARSGLTATQAKGVSEALRKGGVVAIPDGAPNEAIQQYTPGNLPADVFNDRNDTRNRLRDIFGVSGSSSAGLKTDDTVRGKIMSRSLDTDRIGGGVTEYLEQWSDDIFNWLLQILYVYDDGFQFVGGGVPPKLNVSVKEGSLLPKDSTSLANQALELAGLGKISNIDLFKRLEYPNPEELAANVWLETNAPQLLYKDNALVQEAVAAMQAAAAEKAAQDTQSSQENLENDRSQMQMKHENDMEKEAMKGKMKNGDDRSILSEVPQENIGAGP